MKKRKKIFYDDKKNELPFFLRYHDRYILKNVIQEQSNLDVFEAYNSSLSECFSPNKPISMLLNENSNDKKIF